jgi:preprotein translocase subunit YajC
MVLLQNALLDFNMSTKGSASDSLHLKKEASMFSSKLTFVLGNLLTLAAFAEDAGVPVAGPAQAPQPPAWINIALIGGIILFMWLFVIRPQSKRAKEHKNFLSSLTTGMEVVTSGGIVGRVKESTDSFVILDVGNGTIKVLKSSISGKLDANQQAQG